MRRAAQPVLQRTIHLYGAHPDPHLLENVLRRVVGLEAYSEGRVEDGILELPKVLGLAKKMPQLRDARLGLFSQESEAEDWEVFSELRHLSLRVFDNVPSFSFAHLQSLALHRCDNPPSFPLEALPNLRALYTTSKYHDEQGRETLLLLPHFHPQLDMLQVDAMDMEAFPPGLLSDTSPPILCSAGFAVPKLPGLPNLRHLHLLPPTDYRLPSRILLNLQNVLPKLPHLRTISFSHHFRPSAVKVEPSRSRIICTDSDDDDVIVERTVDALGCLEDVLATCAKRNIEVFWRTGSFELSDDYGVSHEFWAYAKELRRREREAAEGGEGGGALRGGQGGGGC